MTEVLTPYARTLRKTPTEAEKCIWRRLRQRQLEGLKFRRQQPIGKYIVDFVCLERRIIVEIDGGQHAESREKDKERDDYLRKNGFEVLRFWNNEVLQNADGVLEVLRRYCLSAIGTPPPQSSPTPGGGR